MTIVRFFWNVLRFLFSFRGRFSPLHFWAGQLCSVLILFRTIFGMQEIHRIQTGKNALPVDGDPLEPYFWSLVIAAGVVSLATAAKRLHDRGKSAGLMYLYLIGLGWLFVW